MKRIFPIILAITLLLPAYAGESGKASLKKGKIELESRKFKDAISSLSEAEKEFSLLGDYALFWLSEAYHEIGNHRDSLNAARTFLKKYPESPLIRKARIMEITEAEEILEENFQQLFESYVKDYPRDVEMKYLFAQWLKKEGNGEKAKSIFKDIYIEAGSFSGPAYHELSSDDLTIKDRIRRAVNLINLMDYKGAETALRSILQEDDGVFKKEILKNLGFSLFKQKKYPQAAEVYRKADERYWEIRSVYRAGEKEAIDSVLEDIIKSGDKRISSIIIAVASDRRREGKTEEAVKLYQDVMDKYPSEREDALWGTGWTYFLSGEYKKATDVFTQLYDMYNDPKYLYWKARSIEAEGEDASSIYPANPGKERSFYSIMSYLKTKGPTDQSSSGNAGKITRKIIPVKETFQSLKKIDRVEALLDLDLSEEALSEMIHISKTTSSIEDIMYICSKFQEFGEYKYSVRLAVKALHMEELHRFLYPLAYWGTVGGLSERYGVDPLLVLSIIREESRFDSEARSPAGALGLMQLMPQTAYRLNSKLKLGINNSHDILNVKNNLHAGIYYLSRLIREFDSYTYAIAAYNAGEETVRKWLKTGNYKSVDEFIEDIPYGETRNYVKRVLTTFFEYKRASAEGDGVFGISIEKL